MRKPVLLFACLCGFAPVSGVACDADATRSMAALEAFASGEWSGHGHFASGKDIAADASFRPVAGGRWLAYEHADGTPGRYRAQGTLGYAASGEFFMTLHDNGGGARFFAGSGWCDDRVVLDKRLDLSQPQHAPVLAERERFVFERVTGDRLKMTYQRGTDDGGWRMVDYVVFDRASQGRAASDTLHPRDVEGGG